MHYCRKFASQDIKTRCSRIWNGAIKHFQNNRCLVSEKDKFITSKKHLLSLRGESYFVMADLILYFKLCSHHIKIFQCTNFPIPAKTDWHSSEKMKANILGYKATGPRKTELLHDLTLWVLFKLAFTLASCVLDPRCFQLPVL